MRFFVIGDREVVVGLRLVGIEGSIATDQSTARDALKKALARENTGVVLITETLAATIRDDVDARIFGTGLPLVLEIPDASGPDPGRRKIEDVVRKAIGVSL